MIVNAAGTLALSNFRRTDAGNLWSYALGESEPRQNPVSDAKWLTLIQGTEDYFAVVHHFATAWHVWKFSLTEEKESIFTAH